VLRDRFDEFVDNRVPSLEEPVAELEELIFEFGLDLTELNDQFTVSAEEVRSEDAFESVLARLLAETRSFDLAIRPDSRVGLHRDVHRIGACQRRSDVERINRTRSRGPRGL